jgi:hypothetical protein
LNFTSISLCLALQAHGEFDAFNTGSPPIKEIANQPKVISPTVPFEVLVAKTSADQQSLQLAILTV